MLRRERGQVTAEYAGMLLVVAALVARADRRRPGASDRERGGAGGLPIAGGSCPGAPPSSADREAVERATAELEALLAGDPDAAAVAGFFAALDPAVAASLAGERPSSSATSTARRSACATPPTRRRSRTRSSGCAPRACRSPTRA